MGKTNLINVLLAHWYILNQYRDATRSPLEIPWGGQWGQVGSPRHPWDTWESPWDARGIHEARSLAPDPDGDPTPGNQVHLCATYRLLFDVRAALLRFVKQKSFPKWWYLETASQNGCLHRTGPLQYCFWRLFWDNQKIALRSKDGQQIKELLFLGRARNIAFERHGKQKTTRATAIPED